MDDGFSNRKIYKDLNIILIDSKKMFGNGFVLPFGPLREPVYEIKRADRVMVVNKNDDEALENLAQIYDTLGDKYNSEIYYNKLLDAVNYNLYIINNESPNPVLYDKYIKKRSEVSKKLNSFK